MRPGGSIRSVIVHDHKLVREGLRLILSRDESIEIVGELAHGPRTIDAISELKPDVVLLDLSAPEKDGIDLIREIKVRTPATKVVLLTAALDEAATLRALKAGAQGYLSRHAGASDLIKAIRTVLQGELWVERKLIPRLLEAEAFSDPKAESARESSGEELTGREREILRLLASGSTNKEIGQALSISEKTVKNHLNSIFKKLQVTRRLKAILYAIQRGLS
ncbi:MAG TPA: response regulator transcription factor [Candidatus Methylomirabilis sp.]|nr:response regulator transcription factor [Candidatus Methylomirabilis sp.]